AGIAPGERVALMSRTRYEWTLVDYAIWAAGAVTVPIYETSSPDQVQWILADSGAVAAFVETDVHFGHVQSVRDGTPQLRQVWRIESEGLGALVAQGSTVEASDVDARRRSSTSDDLA